MPSEKVAKLLKKLNNDKSISKVMDGAIGTLKDFVPLKKDVIATGSLVFDYAVIGIGGIPQGCITELYGAEGAGKTTMAMLLVAEAQRRGMPCIYIDAEASADLKYSEKLGVSIDDLIYIKPETAEQAIDFIYQASQVEGSAGLIVLDTIAAMTPTAALESDAGDVHVALIARLLSNNLPKIRTVLNKGNIALLLLNQVREKIGGYSSHGVPITTPGGRAMRHYTDLRLEIARAGIEKQGTDVIGQTIRMSIKKSRFGAPYKRGEATLIYGKGFDLEGEVFEMAQTVGVITRKGAYYDYGDVRLGMGKAKALDYILEHDLFDEIRDATNSSLVADDDENGIVIVPDQEMADDSKTPGTDS